MGNVILYSNANGSVSLVAPANINENINDVISSTVPPGCDYIVIDEKGIPESNQSTWILAGGEITICNKKSLQLEIQRLSIEYDQDVKQLNALYLAAVVSDGPGEVAKQQAVRGAITARKAQYAADKEAARLKYPV
ncbi:hypothetical protein [Edwardsiella piscicida]|uniref:hypothetical protein n=1 Tax=Edwardsiella piscicida TaxID=1263550 RepID=UPI00247864A0|nr:hypothetical protein [Edwardsiella piscicida]WGS75534.1 hypothetical protein PED68_09145 [Edwardsiella piscicida]WGS78923.1 hypothetical protein PED70_09150 [Edwardsiella piscicida]